MTKYYLNCKEYLYIPNIPNFVPMIVVRNRLNVFRENHNTDSALFPICWGHKEKQIIYMWY